MAAILSALPVAVVFVWLSHDYWQRLFEAERPAVRRQFLAWAAKGLSVPLVVWVIINCGVLPGMPILLPGIALAKSRGGDWMRLLAQSCAPVMLITSSYWAALTFGWLQAVIAGRVQDRQEYKAAVIFWAVLLLPLASLVFYLFRAGGLGFRNKDAIINESAGTDLGLEVIALAATGTVVKVNLNPSPA